MNLLSLDKSRQASDNGDFGVGCCWMRRSFLDLKKNEEKALKAEGFTVCKSQRERSGYLVDVFSVASTHDV